MGDSKFLSEVGKLPSELIFILSCDAMLGESLSPQHGASSACGWRDCLQLWRVAANILNKQQRTNDKGWSSSILHRKKLICYEKSNRASDLDGFFGGLSRSAQLHRVISFLCVASCCLCITNIYIYIYISWWIMMMARGAETCSEEREWEVSK
jgi:phage shock protein PspC (stress-responsive transcriptional regulator)